MGSKKSLAEAYILGLAFGLVGAHHFYLGRKSFGVLYALTFGLFGFGYVFDLFRMKWLVEHVNNRGDTNDSDKKLLSDCYILGLVGGMFGAHHFFLGNTKLGLLYFCTLGVFGLGWLADLVRMRWLHQAYLLDDHSKKVSTAYIMWMSPLGLFGAHQFYLRNYGLGFLYAATVGMFGVGWLVDLVRMKDLTHRCNTKNKEKTLVTAYLLLLSPLGIFGAHHYYLADLSMGLYYTWTAGAAGVGWIVDIVRLPFLLRRWRANTVGPYLDDAYLYWFPFGILGLHQLYLNRPKWAILYLFTGGCLGIGWIIDLFHIPMLVRRIKRQRDSAEGEAKRFHAVCVCCVPQPRKENTKSDLEGYDDLGSAHPGHQQYLEIADSTVIRGLSAVAELHHYSDIEDNDKDDDDDNKDSESSYLHAINTQSDDDQSYLDSAADNTPTSKCRVSWDNLLTTSDDSGRVATTLPTEQTRRPTIRRNQSLASLPRDKAPAVRRNQSMSNKIRELKIQFE